MKSLEPVHQCLATIHLETQKIAPAQSSITVSNLNGVPNSTMYDTSHYRPIYTTSVLGTAPLKMGTRAQNFEHGTSVFCRVNATKIGTGAEKVEGAETFSRGSLGTSSKQCRAQILKKSKICLASRMRKIIASDENLQLAKRKEN